MTSRRPWPLMAVTVVLAASACGGSADEAGAGCDAAWKKAASVSSFKDTPQDYRQTLIECSSIEEWDSANARHGSRLGKGAFTIANYCHELDVDSPLCDVALEETPLRPDR